MSGIIPVASLSKNQEGIFMGLLFMDVGVAVTWKYLYLYIANNKYYVVSYYCTRAMFWNKSTATLCRAQFTKTVYKELVLLRTRQAAQLFKNQEGTRSSTEYRFSKPRLEVERLS